MTPNPMTYIEGLDPRLHRSVEETRALAFEAGALPEKIKYLVALAIDASHGASEGVRALAGQALKSGATREEILETLRVAYFVSGAGSVYTAARALEGIL